MKMDKKTKGKELISSGSPDYPTVYKLNNYNGRNLLDIRKYFKDKKTNELVPSRKGISLNKLGFESLIQIIKNNEKDIIDWLSKNEETPSKELLRKLQNQSKKVQEEIFKAKEYDTKKEKWIDSSFFKIEYNGDKRTIIFNKNHNLSKFIDSKKSKELDTTNIINLLMLSFQHAVDTYSDDQEIKVADFINDLKKNWGIILKNYMKNYE